MLVMINYKIHQTCIVVGHFTCLFMPDKQHYRPNLPLQSCSCASEIKLACAVVQFICFILNESEASS